MHAAGGGEHRCAAGSERQPNQVVPRYHQRRLAIGRDLHDPTAAVERGCDIEISFNIHRKALRTAKTAVKDRDLAVRIDLMNGVETGRGRPSYVEVSVITKRQMISRYTRL